MATKNAEQDTWERSPGYVYFIAAGDPPVAVKIGVTKASRLKDRVREHQGSNHEPLRLLGAIHFWDSERPTADAQAHEQELHRRFANLQRFEAGWAGSEWFTATRGLLAFIESRGQVTGRIARPGVRGKARSGTHSSPEVAPPPALKHLGNETEQRQGVRAVGPPGLEPGTTPKSVSHFR